MCKVILEVSIVIEWKEANEYDTLIYTTYKTKRFLGFMKKPSFFPGSPDKRLNVFTDNL
ncbi:hypothetical protein [Fulvivirga sp. M361]|uniref:hypothetical protein n=1 Tax=Fulvivirga sp. M361 TaxID=2594266 RepID=UPI00162716EA|nr:hypothetical protein [Fulvivirga sp. M361]